jgi:hypothetical protein
LRGEPVNWARLSSFYFWGSLQICR